MCTYSSHISFSRPPFLRVCPWRKSERDLVAYSAWNNSARLPVSKTQNRLKRNINKSTINRLLFRQSLIKLQREIKVEFKFDRVSRWFVPLIRLIALKSVRNSILIVMQRALHSYPDGECPLLIGGKGLKSFLWIPNGIIRYHPSEESSSSPISMPHVYLRKMAVVSTEIKFWVMTRMRILHKSQ